MTARLCVLLAATALTWPWVVPTASAGFDSAPSAPSMSVSTATLAAPASLTASNGTCQPLVSTAVNLSWTATSSTFADGYEIFRSLISGSAYTSIATVSGHGTTTYTDPSPLFATTYYYVVQATKSNWRSPNSNEAAVTTPSTLCV